MLKIKFTILGKPWTIRLMKKKQYKSKNGKGSVGVTKGWKRVIDLRPDGFDLETIVHELVHAYRNEMCINSMDDPDPDSKEEWCAELVAKRGKELLALGDDIYRQVTELTTIKDTNEES